MKWHGLPVKRERSITAVYFSANKGYAVSIIVDARDNMTVSWTERVTGEADDVIDRLQKQLLLHDMRYSEIVICLDDEVVNCIEQVFPPLNDRELDEAIRMEVEYTSGKDALWCCEHVESNMKIRTIAKEQLSW